MLPVSLDCPFTLPLRYSLTFICPVSRVPYVASFSGLSFLLPFRYSLTCICPVSCAPYVASFSGLSFFITLSVFSNMYLSCVLCTLCCQFLWIVHFWLPLRYSLTCICHVSCAPNVDSGLSFFFTPSVFSNIYLSCVMCTLCYQFLWIILFYCPFGILKHLFVLCLVYPMLPVSLDCPFLLLLRYSPTFICHVSCVPSVASFSWLSLFITPSVLSIMYLSCVFCTLCCQFLWIVLFHYPFGIL
jgi:hypothetical protein